MLERIRNELARLASEELTELRFAYVFGSAATGLLRPDSDVDVAIDLGRQATLADISLVASVIEKATSRPSDVVDLRRAGPVLCMQVLRHGLLVFDRDPCARAEFEMYTPSIYFDFRIEQREVERALLERVS